MARDEVFRMDAGADAPVAVAVTSRSHHTLYLADGNWCTNDQHMVPQGWYAAYGRTPEAARERWVRHAQHEAEADAAADEYDRRRRAALDTLARWYRPEQLCFSADEMERDAALRILMRYPDDAELLAEYSHHPGVRWVLLETCMPPTDDQRAQIRRALGHDV